MALNMSRVTTRRYNGNKKSHVSVSTENGINFTGENKQCFVTARTNKVAELILFEHKSAGRDIRCPLLTFIDDMSSVAD
jgi:hypothetical protein